MIEVIQSQIQATEELFSSRGWKVVILGKHNQEESGLEVRYVVKNSRIRCADPRYLDESCEGPAIPGGVDGIAAMEDYYLTPEMRFQIAVDKIIKSGQEPAWHGDKNDGDWGCGFRKGLLEGRFSGFPKLLPLNSSVLRSEIHHEILDGKHEETEMVINWEDGTTVLPQGRRLVKDGWYLRSLGYDSHKILNMFVQVGELLLPSERRTLYIR